MNNVVKCCVNLPNIIAEERNGDGRMSTTNIVSVDPNATVSPIRVLKAPADSFEEAELYRLTTDRVEDGRDHMMMCNSFADTIWERVGNGELDNFILAKD